MPSLLKLTKWIWRKKTFKYHQCIFAMSLLSLLEKNLIGYTWMLVLILLLDYSTWLVYFRDGAKELFSLTTLT